MDLSDGVVSVKDVVRSPNLCVSCMKQALRKTDARSRSNAYCDLTVHLVLPPALPNHTDVVDHYLSLVMHFKWILPATWGPSDFDMLALCTLILPFFHGTLEYCFNWKDKSVARQKTEVRKSDG